MYTNTGLHQEENKIYCDRAIESAGTSSLTQKKIRACLIHVSPLCDIKLM